MFPDGKLTPKMEGHVCINLVPPLQMCLSLAALDSPGPSGSPSLPLSFRTKIKISWYCCKSSQHPQGVPGVCVCGGVGGWGRLSVPSMRPKPCESVQDLWGAHRLRSPTASNPSPLFTTVQLGASVLTSSCLVSASAKGDYKRRRLRGLM